MRPLGGGQGARTHSEVQLWLLHEGRAFEEVSAVTPGLHRPAG